MPGLDQRGIAPVGRAPTGLAIFVSLGEAGPGLCSPTWALHGGRVEKLWRSGCQAREKPGVHHQPQVSELSTSLGD